jgi:hypothetical protein
LSGLVAVWVGARAVPALVCLRACLRRSAAWQHEARRMGRAGLAGQGPSQRAVGKDAVRAVSHGPGPGCILTLSRLRRQRAPAHNPSPGTALAWNLKAARLAPEEVRKVRHKAPPRAHFSPCEPSSPRPSPAFRSRLPPHRPNLACLVLATGWRAAAVGALLHWRERGSEGQMAAGAAWLLLRCVVARVFPRRTWARGCVARLRGF